MAWQMCHSQGREDVHRNLKAKLQFGLCIPCTKSPGPAGVESVWVGSGNSCPERPLNPFFTQVLLIIRASVVVNPSDGLQ